MRKLCLAIAGHRLCLPTNRWPGASEPTENHKNRWSLEDKTGKWVLTGESGDSKNGVLLRGVTSKKYVVQIGNLIAKRLSYG